MLIVSKFHDYYDSASSFGVDKTCVYLRKENWFQIKKSFQYPREYESKSHRFEVHFRIIGFCGNLCPLVLVKKLSGKSLIVEDCFYSSDEAIQYLESEKILTGKYDHLSSLKRDLKVFFQEDFSYLQRQFVEKKVPVFLCGYRIGYGTTEVADNGDDTNLVTNIELKLWKFFRIKDPHTAFQDIFMYLSGVLGAPAPPMIEIADKYKQAAKGHDGEYSFKRPPGKKGKVKWR